MRAATTIAAAVFAFLLAPPAAAQAKKTLVAVWAHADDEIGAMPVLARYAREGAQVYMIVATDGSQGGSHTAIPRGPELARARAQEARCAADALGIHAPIILGFPDSKLGDYADEPARLMRLTGRIHEELQRLAPDALITWGPDGGTGHPDHRIVSSIVTQLVRAGAPGIPERLFYTSLPAESMRAANPERGMPPMLIPQAKYFTVRVPFTPADFEAARKSMGCHKTQFSEEVVGRVTDVLKTVWNGVLPMVPALTTGAANDVFQSPR